MSTTQPPQDHIIRAKTLAGALSHAQAMAQAALDPLLKTAPAEVAKHLRQVAAALREADVGAAQKGLALAIRAARAPHVAQIEEVQRLVATHYRYAYSAHDKPGRRRFETVPVDERFKPEGYPVWIELLNAAGDPISGPYFVEPKHPGAVDEPIPVSPAEYKTKYNTWVKAMHRAKRGIKPSKTTGRSYRIVSNELDQAVGTLQEKLDAASAASPLVGKLLATQSVQAELDALQALANELRGLAYRPAQ